MISTRLCVSILWGSSSGLYIVLKTFKYLNEAHILDLDGMKILTCISRNRIEGCGPNRDRCLSRRNLHHRLKLVLDADICLSYVHKIVIYVVCVLVFQVHVDPAVTAQLLGFLSQCVEMKGPLLVDQLFHAVTSSYIPQDRWASMFKTPQDLSTFLKMHSDVFHVQSNLVTLISAAPQTSPTKSRSKANSQTSTNPQLCSPTHQNNSSNNNNVISPSSNVITLSNVNNNTEHQSVCPTPPATALQNQTLKQRINSLVMKTIAHNTERDRSYAATSLANNISTAGGATGTDAWKAKVLQNTKVIVSVKESLQVSEALFVECDLRFIE